MQYKYKVCKGQKVLALSTTLREAEQEARRVGGVVLTIGSKRRNPLDPTSTATYVPQGTMVGAETFYNFAQEVGVPSEQQTMAKMIRLYNRLQERGYVYPSDAGGHREVIKDIPVKAFFDAAHDVGLIAASKSASNIWRRAGARISVYDLDFEVGGAGFLHDLYEQYDKLSAKQIGTPRSIAHKLSDRLIDTGDCRSESYNLIANTDITKDHLRTLAKQVLEERLATIGPKRIKKERVRVATRKAKAEQATADKQAHEGASKFKLRPVGDATVYEGVPQPADAAPVQPSEKYLVTMLAPKCFAPVAYYFMDLYINGYSPDLTLYYTQAKFDGSETSDDGIHRIHMNGLQNYDEDKGKGIGPLAYISTPFAALDKWPYQQAAVFSPREDPNDKYIYRSDDADHAWANLNRAGLVTEEYEAGEERVSERVDLYDYFEAGSGILDEWDSLDNISPRYATLEGTKGEGGEVILDVLHLRTVLLERMTLHVEKELYDEIIRRRVLLPGDNDPISPPAETWADIDLLHCTPDEVERMVEFCSRHWGGDQDVYLREVAGVIGTNPTYRKGTLDNLLSKFGVEVKTQNPRRRNPEAQSWVNKHKQAFWDAPDAAKQAGQEPEAKKNPKASKKLSANQQKKYLGTLKGAAREARASEILHRREHRSNKPFKTDKGQQTKKSSHATKFAQKYGRAPHDVADAAQLARVPERVLKEVYARGMAAWQTGHRPGASQHAWAMARVESFLTGGPTSKTADADLARKLR